MLMIDETVLVVAPKVLRVGIQFFFIIIGCIREWITFIIPLYECFWKLTFSIGVSSIAFGAYLDEHDGKVYKCKCHGNYREIFCCEHAWLTLLVSWWDSHFILSAGGCLWLDRAIFQNMLLEAHLKVVLVFKEWLIRWFTWFHDVILRAMKLLCKAAVNQNACMNEKLEHNGRHLKLNNS